MWRSRDILHSTIEHVLEKHKESSNKILVIIMSPTNMHYEHLNLAIKHGYNIVCEKSLVASSSEITSIKKSVMDNKIFLRNIFNYSGYPMVREMRSLIMDGHIGSVNQIICEMPQEGLVRPLIQGEHKGPQSWRLSDGEIPMVCLDLGVHLHHLIEFTTDIIPNPKYAVLKNLTAYPKINDTQFILFQGNNDSILGSMWFTKSAIGTRNGLY